MNPPKRPTRPANLPPEQHTQRRPKNEQQAILEHGPWKPHAYELADVSAYQALARGDATADQQKRALAWLIGAAGTYDLSYRPGAAGERDTTFAEGKRFVGLQAVKLLNLNLALLRRSEPLGDKHEPKS